jgi:signal transduction histidine kinase
MARIRFGRPGRTRSMRSTLTALLIVPLISLVLLWAFGVSVTLGNALRDRTYNHLVSSGAKYDDELETQLASERLQTFIWLSTGRRSPVAPLTAVRKKTDAVLTAYFANGQQSRGKDSAALQAIGDRFNAQLRTITRVRAAVDSGSVSPSEGFQDYSNLVDDLFTLFDSSGTAIGVNLNVYTQTTGAVQAARTLEDVSRELTLAGGALAVGGQMTAGDRVLFASAVAGQRVLISEAMTAFNPAERAGFQRAYSSPLHARFAGLEDQIVATSATAAGPSPATLQAFTGTGQEFIKQMETAQLALNAPIAATAGHDGNQALLEAILAGGLGLLAVIASILLTVWYGRRMTGELTELNEDVRAMADERLPSVVGRLRDGHEVDIEAESPPPATGKITEIATVAESFATVQRTAVEAAVGQANLRKGVNQVFLNLSLRNQSLLHRQLTMLDSMERAARDPASLDELFRLDHLTTRMRRHAEGLIILAGATPARGWRDPVPVVDVLRAAIAEVEDYVRIDVISESRDAIAGAAVNDVIHLIAELAENAAAFSPPTTQVEIKADGVAKGLAVEIEDRGLGLSAEEMAEINQRLASPPEFDLANSDQLGLFVVGQLAARHGIRVSLRSSPYGGTIAIVLMPTSIVVREGEVSGPAGPHEPQAGGLPLAVSAPAPPMPERMPAIAAPAPGPESSAAVFSLTGRHRLGSAGTESEIVPDPWPTVTPAGPPAPRPVAAERPRAPWEQASWARTSWGEPPAATVPSRAPAAPVPPAEAPAAADPATPRGDSPARLADAQLAETHLGMPVRVRQASLAPQLRTSPGPRPAAPAPSAGGSPVRSPEQARNLMAALQRGWEHGRTDDLDDPDGDLGAWRGPDAGDGEVR